MTRIICAGNKATGGGGLGRAGVWAAPLELFGVFSRWRRLGRLPSGGRSREPLLERTQPGLADSSRRFDGRPRHASAHHSLYALDAPFRMAFGAPFRMALGAPFRMALGAPFRIALGVPFRMAFGVPFRMAFSVPFRMAFSVPLGVPFGAAAPEMPALERNRRFRGALCAPGGSRETRARPARGALPAAPAARQRSDQP